MFNELYNKLTEKFDAEKHLAAPTPKDLASRRIDKTKLIDNKDGTFDYDGHLDFEELNLTTLTDLPYKFRKVSGYFSCQYNKLTSLEGVPEIVVGVFYCNYNKLTSLEGAPEKVGGNFYCAYNQLTSLEGAPREVGGLFYCLDNPVSREDLLKTINRK